MSDDRERNRRRRLIPEYRIKQRTWDREYRRRVRGWYAEGGMATDDEMEILNAALLR